MLSDSKPWRAHSGQCPVVVLFIGSSQPFRPSLLSCKHYCLFGDGLQVFFLYSHTRLTSAASSPASGWLSISARLVGWGSDSIRSASWCNGMATSARAHGPRASSGRSPRSTAVMVSWILAIEARAVRLVPVAVALRAQPRHFHGLAVIVMMPFDPAPRFAA